MPPPPSPTRSPPPPASTRARSSPTKPDSPHHDLAELYVAFAENDQSATPENVERFRTELEQQGVRGVVERLPGTSHGFAMADLPVYHRAAAEHHFERTLDLWRRNLAAEAVEA